MSESDSRGSKLEYNLILLYGAGSGFGKSTLAQAIVDHLTSRNVSTCLVEEHDVLNIPQFQDYVQLVQKGHTDDATVLVNCCARYIRFLEMNLPQVTVMDSIFPCWDWLRSADCSTEKILQFSSILFPQLQRLNPLLIIVEGEMNVALTRAMLVRGEDWALDKAEQRTGVREVGAFRDYLSGLRKTTEECLSSWPYKVIRVNTTNQTREHSLIDVLEVFYA